jgi:predicted transcriptional regulator of viral defense system
MNTAGALARLQRLNVSAFTTADARAAFGGSTASASQTLAALADRDLAFSLRRGLWSLQKDVDPLLLPEHLSAPAPSYVSLWTALYRHGVIEQIPAVVYVVTLGKTKRYETTAGTFSLHRVSPEMFCGFEVTKEGIKLATVEKAIVDVAYLSGVKSRLFSSLPEIELPRSFDFTAVQRYLDRIPAKRHRTLAAVWLARNIEKRARARTSVHAARRRGRSGS